MATRKGKIVEVTIRDLAYDGKAVGEIDGKVVFLNGGLPGETVVARLTKCKPRYDTGKVLEIKEKSPERTDAPCRHFDICGGCTWQDLDYKKQLEYKRKQVIECLEHIGKIKDAEIAPIVGAPDQFHYRNKMEFSFHVDEEEGFVLGLHHRGQFDRIFNLEECLLQSDTANEIVRWFAEYVKKENIPVYHITEHTGYLRFFMLRETANTGQLMVNIITSEGEFPDRDRLVEEMTGRFPQITTIVHNINSKKANIAKGEAENVLYGPGYIEETIMGRRFRIYANSFFQTNSRQAENLYRIGFDLLSPSPDQSLLDLYCGAGTIGLAFADKLNRVVGIELEPTAVNAAKENAELNRIENAEFICGSAQDLMKERPGIFNELDCAIVDPPRAGLHKKAMKGLIEFDYPKLTYISCNPATFARDAALLLQAGYKLNRVIPVDMFPHTLHIELAAGFSKD